MLGTDDDSNYSPFDSRPLRHRTLDELVALQEQLLAQADAAAVQEEALRIKWVAATAKLSRLNTELAQLAWEILDARN
jgi:hypothetical protein